MSYLIRIVSLTGSNSVYMVDGDETVRQLKMRIMLREGIPLENQRLVFHDKELTDNMTMETGGVYEDCEVRLLVALKGGPYQFYPTSISSVAHIFDEDDDEDGLDTCGGGIEVQTSHQCEGEAMKTNLPPFEAIEECFRNYESSMKTGETLPKVVYFMCESGDGEVHIVRATRVDDECESPSSPTIASESSPSYSQTEKTAMMQETLSLQHKMALIRLKMDSKRLNKKFSQKHTLHNATNSTSPSRSAAVQPPTTPTKKDLLSPTLQRCTSLSNSPAEKLSETTQLYPPRMSSLSPPPRPRTAAAQLSLRRLTERQHLPTVSTTTTTTTSVVPLQTQFLPPLSHHTSLVSTPQNDSTKIPGKRSRISCFVCHKRLTLVNAFDCRCGLTLCQLHRYPEEHPCSVDYKREGRERMRDENPLVAPNKLLQM